MPITKNKKPDLRLLIYATKISAKNLKKNSIVIHESTVYPGATEEVYPPLIEKVSGLKVKKDFVLGCTQKE
jgi:UDP-N-acetyl-D-galactosamine dehydrogenase